MNHSVSCNVYSIPTRTCNCGFDLKPDPLVADLRDQLAQYVSKVADLQAQLAQAVEAKKKSATMTCECLIQSTCRLPPLHPGICMDEADIELAALRAKAEKLARTLRAEDCEAAVRRSIEAGFAAERADRTKAEARAGRLSAHLDKVYDRIGLKDSNRCPDGVQTAIRVMEVRAADAERSRVWAETQATKALARADAAEARVREETTRADAAAQCAKHPSHALKAALVLAEAELEKYRAAHVSSREELAELEKYRAAHVSSREELAAQHQLVEEHYSRYHETRRRAEAAEARLKAETTRADLATENLRMRCEEREALRKDLAEKCPTEAQRQHELDDALLAVSKERVRADLAEAMRRLDGIAGEVTTMRKRLKGSLE